MTLKINKPGYHNKNGKPVGVGTIVPVSGDRILALLLNKRAIVGEETEGKDWATGQNPGPTVEEYVAAGYRAESYPPQGHEPRSTPEKIETAIKVQKAADEAAKKTTAKA